MSHKEKGRNLSCGLGIPRVRITPPCDGFGGFVPPCARPTLSRAALWCELPSWRLGDANCARESARRGVPAPPAPSAKRLCGPPSSGRVIPPASAARTACAGGKPCPCASRASPASWFARCSCPAAERRASRPSGAPWRARWRSPAGGSGRHVFLPGYGASPPARTHPPACWATFLPSHLPEPVLWFPFPAHATSHRSSLNWMRSERREMTALVAASAAAVQPVESCGI